MKKNTNRLVLLVEDDELFLQAMEDSLTGKYKVMLAKSAEDALGLLNKQLPDVVMLDITLPGMDGIEGLKKINGLWPELPVIMMTAIDRISMVVECIKKGAVDYLAKPFVEEELHSTIERAIEASDVKRQLELRRKLQLVTNKEYRLLGVSAAIESIHKEIQVVAKYDSPVLIQGATGTGKELVAREIHGNSLRASGSFVAINCGAIPKDLVESEFFGYKKGAFTGAQGSEIGKFQLADHGSLLLDEISELPLDAQTKLLRVLEEHEFYPVGSTQLVRVDVRIIASTNKNLSEMVRRNLFREDLLFRLNVFSISIPPLRDRTEDIIVLSEYFLKHFSSKFDKQFQGISDDAKDLFLKHSWNGNVRELRNLIERVVLSENGPLVEEAHLHFMDSVPSSEYNSGSIKLTDSGIDLEEVEKKLILEALKMAKGNKTKAAKLLNLSPPTLYYRLEKYRID
jgi:DNA-binding NtrC family response regulator